MMSEMEWMKIFADNLVYLLAQRHMSQNELSRLTGIDQGSISRYISGRQLPGVRAIVNIAYVLGLTVDDLINFDDMIEM